MLRCPGSSFSVLCCTQPGSLQAWRSGRVICFHLTKESSVFHNPYTPDQMKRYPRGIQEPTALKRNPRFRTARERAWNSASPWKPVGALLPHCLWVVLFHVCAMCAQVCARVHMCVHVCSRTCACMDVGNQRSTLADIPPEAVRPVC